MNNFLLRKYYIFSKGNYPFIKIVYYFINSMMFIFYYTLFCLTGNKNFKKC